MGILFSRLSTLENCRARHQMPLHDFVLPSNHFLKQVFKCCTVTLLYSTVVSLFTLDGCGKSDLFLKSIAQNASINSMHNLVVALTLK